MQAEKEEASSHGQLVDGRGFEMLWTRSFFTHQRCRLVRHIYRDTSGGADIFCAMLWLAIVVLTVFSRNIFVQGNPIVQAPVKRKCGKVHLTVSSLKETYLELNWIVDCYHPLDVEPTFIALYETDPRGREDITPVEKIFASDHPNGFYRTLVKFGEPYLPGNWEYSENLTSASSGKHCFPYWAASLSEEGTIIHAQCLGIRPTWMNDNRQALLHQRMDRTLIPGTHNSGAYDPSRLANIVQNYVLNQDRLIWTQLVFGIRYFDLRVGYYKNDGFYINHDLVRITPLRPVLKQIRKFLELTDEIVLLDFHRFPYPTDFTQDIHNALLDIVYEELGEFASLRTDYSGVAPFFFEVWDNEKQVIISYADNDACKERVWLWYGISQYWADTVSTSDLKSYMEDKINSHSTGNNPFWALMAELTPQAIDIILLTNDLRKLADDVNRHITKWFRDDWSQQSINIVASDFFLGNDLINVAIREAGWGS